MPRGWKDWVRGLAIWGVGPDEELRLIRTDERGYLQVVQMPHAVTHQDGGSDEINVQGLSGVLADLQRGKFSFVGNYADFPAPGEEDRLAFAVDQLTVYRDTGTSWQKVATAHWDYIEGVPSSFPPAAHARAHEEGGSDALTPANIGANWDKLVNKPSTFPPSPHAASHQDGGADEINVNGLSGQLADYQKSRWDLVDGKPSTFPPSAHASSHRPGGSDALPTAAPAAITEGATGAEGSSTALARADHVHETPSQWTPKEHGNEAHNPDFVAADGSVHLSSDWELGTASFWPVLKKFVVPLYVDYHTAPVLSPFLNHLAFNTLRGGSVSFNPAPNIGSGEALFDAAGSVVSWSNPSGTIVVEVSFHSVLTDMNGWGISFRGSYFATDFVVEVYDSVDAVWKTVAEISGNTRNEVHGQYLLWGSRASKLRFTFTGFNSPNYFQITQIYAWNAGQDWKEYVVFRDGGDVYGDIDMNGNDIVNPGLVDGVDVSSHAARHQPGGVDEVRPGKYVNSLIFQTTQTTPSAYTSLSTGIGCRALVFLRIYNGSGGIRVFYFQPGDETTANGDNTDATHGLSPIWLENGRVAHTIMTTDSSGNLRWRADAAVTGVGVRVLAYIKLI